MPRMLLASLQVLFARGGVPGAILLLILVAARRLSPIVYQCNYLFFKLAIITHDYVAVALLRRLSCDLQVVFFLRLEHMLALELRLDLPSGVRIKVEFVPTE